jgi:hypothetical protein
VHAEFTSYRLIKKEYEENSACNISSHCLGCEGEQHEETSACQECMPNFHFPCTKENNMKKFPHTDHKPHMKKCGMHQEIGESPIIRKVAHY